MKKKIFIFISIFIISLFFFYFIVNYDVTVKTRQELVKISPPSISLMIFKGATDEEIISEVQKNPSIVNQKCSGCVLTDLKTPLITAIVYERTELVKYLIRNGSSIEDAINILKADPDPNCEFFLSYLNKIRNDLENSGYIQ